MRKMNSEKILTVLLSFMVLTAWIDPFRDEVSKGNGSFHDKKYSDAKSHYKKAEEYAPGEDDKKKLSFNKGAADYMTEDYDSAIAGYQSAIQSGDREIQKKAFFNLGNVHMKKGDYKEAVSAYINALKIDPNYVKAKKNMEYLLQNKKNNDRNKQCDNRDRKEGDNKKDKKREGEKKPDNKMDDKTRETKDSGQKKMSREQIQNILKSMKNKPVRRQKGSSGERSNLERYW